MQALNDSVVIFLYSWFYSRFFSYLQSAPKFLCNRCQAILLYASRLINILYQVTDF